MCMASYSLRNLSFQNCLVYINGMFFAPQQAVPKSL